MLLRGPCSLSQVSDLLVLLAIIAAVALAVAIAVTVSITVAVTVAVAVSITVAIAVAVALAVAVAVAIAAAVAVAIAVTVAVAVSITVAIPADRDAPSHATPVRSMTSYIKPKKNPMADARLIIAAVGTSQPPVAQNELQAVPRPPVKGQLPTPNSSLSRLFRNTSLGDDPLYPF